MTRARRRPQPAVAALAAALAFASLAVPAQAGVFDQDAIKRVDATDQRLDQIQHDIDARLGAIEQQLKSQGLADLFNQLEQLKADVARLRGQIEVLANDVDQQQKRQRDLYVDLDTRLRKLETSPPPAAAPDAGQPPAAGTPAAALPPSPAEQKAYDAALDQFKRADYAGAITGFGAFVRQYPQSSLAASAQYWIGNAQFARRDFKGAIASQRALIQQFPDSPKVPDAMLNIASAQSELGDNAGARRTLEDLIAKYPSTDAGVKARQRLAIR
jgi:tol-pal system protein YbgF